MPSTEEKIEELTSNRDWGNPEDDPGAEMRSVEVAEEPTEEAGLEAGTILPPTEEAKAKLEPVPEETLETLKARAEELEKQSEGRLRALIQERRGKGDTNAMWSDLRDQIEQLRLEKEAAAAPPPPDPEEQPLDYMESVVNNRFDELKNEIVSFKESAAMRELEEDAVRTGQVAAVYESEFKQEHSDYDEAYKHVYAAYHNDLSSTPTPEGRYLTPAEVDGTIRSLAYQTTKQALAQGRNPAEVVYEEAKRLGFAPKAPAPQGIDPKVKAGSERVSLSQPGFEGHGNTPEGRKGEVTREWIFENLDKAQRTKIWSTPHLNEEVMRTGKTTLPENFFD